MRLERFDDARSSFARCTVLDPDHTESHYGLGLIYMQQGQKDQARQKLEKVLSLQPDHQRARAKLAALDQQL